jgi:hypothetical protein
MSVVGLYTPPGEILVGGFSEFGMTQTVPLSVWAEKVGYSRRATKNAIAVTFNLASFQGVVPRSAIWNVTIGLINAITVEVES